MDEETQDLAKQNKKPSTIIKEHIDMIKEDSHHSNQKNLENRNWAMQTSNSSNPWGKITLAGKDTKGWRMIHQQKRPQWKMSVQS